MGTGLLRRLAAADARATERAGVLISDADWSAERYTAMKKRFEGMEFLADSRMLDLPELCEFLVSSRDFMLRLLENPLLLEHVTFTDLLWATFHFTEELEDRSDLLALSQADLDHLSNDISRAYGLLARQWLDYMLYLKSNYPYLYSLAMRTNPFDSEARAEIE